MRSLSIIILCIMLLGCGKEYLPNTAGSTVQPAVSGVHVDKAYFDTLDQEFKETTSCTGLNGDFWDVAIFLMPPPNFPCNGKNLEGKMCYGEFIRPNKVLLADRYSWKHEIIHYLLYQNTGDLDPNHESEMFDNCS